MQYMTRSRLRAVLTLCGLFFIAASARAQQPALWTWTSDNLTLRGNVSAHAQLYSMRGTWWNLAASSAPTFDTDRTFTELWLHPQLSADYQLAPKTVAYGKLSVGITQNIGADAFDYRDEGAARFENAFAGVRGEFADGWRYDLSLGRQSFTLGSGMLLTAGSANGFSWGGGASTPRKAWARTAIGRLSYGDFSVQGFQLEPSEAPEARTDTRVQGASLEWKRDKLGKAGLAWITVPRSTAIYPGDLAPLSFIERGREGLDTWQAWLDLTGVVPGAPGLGLRAEYAQQRNDITRVGGKRDPMRAEAWLLGVSYWAQTWWFAPRFSYHVARFSGDKPGTATYERFDPMFWGNGLDNWWFGANGAYAWLNANVRARRAIVDAYASAKDIVQFQFVRTSADQLNSAIQYGQGVQFTSSGLLVGVPTAHLSDEYYAQYARVISPALVGIAFVSRNVPGDGLKANAPQGVKTWTTVGVGLTANF